VLALFDHQAEDIHERLRQMIEGQAADAGEMAHRIKGAARGIGAFEVAAAAETLEQASSPAAIHEAAQGLRDAIRLTRLEIAEILSLS
jgi:HPt (histidine-containing phosphotransfer) domain-containing protein